jgi:hypothetical protein
MFTLIPTDFSIAFGEEKSTLAYMLGSDTMLLSPILTLPTLLVNGNVF